MFWDVTTGLEYQTESSPTMALSLQAKPSSTSAKKWASRCVLPRCPTQEATGKWSEQMQKFSRDRRPKPLTSWKTREKTGLSTYQAYCGHSEQHQAELLEKHLSSSSIEPKLSCHQSSSTDHPGCSHTMRTQDRKSVV